MLSRGERRTQFAWPIGTPEPSDEVLALTGAEPSPSQRFVALVLVPAIMAVVFCVVRPFGTIQLRSVEAFVPFYVSALFVTDAFTAVILFSQFSILRTRALLVIANGYVFAALILIPYVLAFPGIFIPGQALIGGLQSTDWIYILRLCGLASFMI